MESGLLEIEGTWEQVTELESGLRGKRVRVLVLPESSSESGGNPNPSLLPMPEPRITQPLNLRIPTEEERAASVAYFRELSQNVLTDPEEIEKAEAEYAELLKNLQDWH